MTLYERIQSIITALIRYKKMLEKRQKLYQTAVSFLGVDASPRDLADDEYGCAESVNQVFRKAFGEWASPINILSTKVLYETMAASSKFEPTQTPQEGTIIISPTGYSKKNAKTGHVGICGRNGIVMSNDSRSGLWLENYAISSWKIYYKDRLGFPIYYFNVL